MLPTVPLGEICQVKYGKGLSKKDRSHGEFPVMGSNGQVGTHKEGFTNSPCIVIGRKGSIGKVHYIESSCWPIDTAYFIDDWTDSWYPEYVYFFLKIAGLSSQNKAGAIPSLLRPDLEAVGVPFRSVHEQRRIVARIKECLERVEKIERLSSESYQEAEVLRQAVLHDIEESLKSEAERRGLGSLIKVASGQFLPTNKMEKDGNFPVYGGNGIAGMHDQFLFKKPVIVIGRVGAKCGCVHITAEHSWVTDNALYVKEEYEDFDQRFLAYMLEGANLRQYARQAAQPVISGKVIYPVEIPFVLLTRQSVIADMIESALSGIAQLLAQHSERAKEATALRESILRKAFAGEL